MKERYSREQFENFMEGMKRVSDLARTEHPDVFLVSLNGGQPLFDVLTIANRDVDPSAAVYFPLSSKIKDCADVASRCFTNYLLEKQDETHEPQRILSIDEVVSGGSVDRLWRAYDKARRIVAKYNIGKHDREAISEESEHLETQFPLKVIGVKEERVRTKKRYKEHVAEGKVLEVPVQKIITMDDPDMHVPIFDHPQSKGWNGQGYFPRVKEYRITERYMSFLQDVARYFGVDPADVTPRGLGRIKDHSARYSKKPNLSKE